MHLSIRTIGNPKPRLRGFEMTLDNERQRELLLSMIQVCNVPGSILDDVYELKQAVFKADVVGGDNGTDRTAAEV